MGETLRRDVLMLLKGREPCENAENRKMVARQSFLQKVDGKLL